MLIRNMTIADVDEVYIIEQETFSNPWSRASFIESLSDNVLILLQQWMAGWLDIAVLGRCRRRAYITWQ